MFPLLFGVKVKWLFCRKTILNPMGMIGKQLWCKTNRCRGRLPRSQGNITWALKSPERGALRCKPYRDHAVKRYARSRNIQCGKVQVGTNYAKASLRNFLHGSRRNSPIGTQPFLKFIWKQPCGSPFQLYSELEFLICCASPKLVKVSLHIKEIQTNSQLRFPSCC